TFLAAIVNYSIGAHYGWRAVFAVGGAPALLIAFIRYGVRESGRWQHRVAKLEGTWSARRAFFALFSAEYRRRTLVNAALLFVCIALGFGYVFYLPENALPRFLACLFFLGIGGANFAVYTLWLPEQYRTECRGSAFAFATSIGRFLAAGITFLVGAGVARMHT